MSNSIPDGLDVLAVEPNIEKHSEFDVIDYKEALEHQNMSVVPEFAK